ncbi:MAG: Coq4 family protein [Cyanobacteria bacterium P01_A01_bin.114]
MATFIRTLQAFQDRLAHGQVGDAAFLRTQVIGMSANPNVVAQLKKWAGHIPDINLDQLSQLPSHTLGHQYAHHMKANNIQPLQISPDLQPEAQQSPFALRFTLSHDVFHVLLGFDTSYAGEAGVLAFTMAQNYSFALSAYQPVLTLLYPLIFSTEADQMRANIRKGETLGQRASCLLAYPFEQNWSRPIAAIRTELGLNFP